MNRHTRGGIATALVALAVMSPLVVAFNVGDGVTFSNPSQSFVLGVHTGYGMNVTSNVTYDANGSVVFDGFTVDVRSTNTTNVYWNVSAYVPGTLIKFTRIADGNASTLELKGWSGAERIGVDAGGVTSVFNVSAVDSGIVNISGNATVIRAYINGSQVPDTLGNFSTLGSNRTVWGNTSIGFTSVSNFTNATQVMVDSWRDGTSDPGTFTAVPNLTYAFNQTTPGIWNVSYYMVDQDGNRGLTRSDNITLGHTHLLQPGWNVLSFPEIGSTGVNSTSFFANAVATGHFVNAWTYNASSGQWSLYDPTVNTSGFMMNWDTVVYVQANGTSPITVAGGYVPYNATATNPISPGWNTIRLQSIRTPVAIATALASESSIIHAAWVFNAVTQQWVLWSPGNPYTSGSNLVDDSNGIIIYATGSGSA